MMPLHSWLPRAHPAAPSHASALMSGVMVKIGIFGILKVAMDLLAQTGLPLWWGILVMAIGAISALLGVLYALAEQDIKRLLAWSTVENVGIILLAVTGGLAVMCFVKMYGITFCGAPRSTHAEEAQEVPNTMIVAMLLLAALCVLIALSASWLAPKIMHIAHAFTDTPPVTVASGIALVPGTFHTRVTPSLLLLLLLAMPLLPGLYWLWCRSRRAAFRRTGDAWACGYGWENAMAPSGNGVMQPLRVVFSALFRLRQQLDPTLRLNKGLAHVTARAQSTEPFWDERVIRPIVSATQRLAKEIQHLQSGDFRLYCLYVVAALVVLLIAIAV